MLAGELPADGGDELSPVTPKDRIEDARRQILAEVVAGVRASPSPVPLEALADRALRALGHEKTIATGWAGAGSFRELLRRGLPEEIRLTDEPPYLAFDARRHVEPPAERRALEAREPRAEIPAPPVHRQPEVQAPLAAEPIPHHYQTPVQAAPLPTPRTPPVVQHSMEAFFARPERRTAPAQREAQPRADEAPLTRPAPQPQAPAPPPQRTEPAPSVQQSIARIQEACQAPPLAPPEYRLLFEIMAKEITDNDLIGAQTLTNITQRAQERGLDLRRDDVRFVLEVVSEADPWFEQGASANLFAGRFRNFVVARCRGQGLNLSADELDLIDAWFAGGTLPQGMAAPKPVAQTTPAPTQPSATGPTAETRASPRWWSLDDGRSHALDQRPAAGAASAGTGYATAQGAAAPAAAGAEEFPRIVRTRLRG